MGEVEPLTALRDEVRGLQIFGRRLHVYLRFRRSVPVLVLLQVLLGLAQRGEERVEPLAVAAARLVVERTDLSAHFVQDALPIADAVKFALHFLRSARDEK